MSWTVYCHTHVESGRRYVGLTKYTMMHRWNQHCAQAKRSGDGRSYFQNAIRKYGKDAFSHEVLGKHETLEEANTAEQRWIEELDTRDPEKGFNLSKGGDSHPSRPLRSNPWLRPEYRARMLDVKKELWSNPSYRTSLTGWKHSPVTLQKISSSSSSRHHHSATRGKISNSLKRTKSLVVPGEVFL
jgi:group I intron endonuclease